MFRDGTTEVELAGQPVAGSGGGARGFVGIAFRKTQASAPCWGIAWAKYSGRSSTPVALDINNGGLQLLSVLGVLKLGYGVGPLSEIQISPLPIAQQLGLDSLDFAVVRTARVDLGISDSGQFVG